MPTSSVLGTTPAAPWRPDSQDGSSVELTRQRASTDCQPESRSVRGYLDSAREEAPLSTLTSRSGETTCRLSGRRGSTQPPAVAPRADRNLRTIRELAAHILSAGADVLKGCARATPARLGTLEQGARTRKEGCHRRGLRLAAICARRAHAVRRQPQLTEERILRGLDFDSRAQRGREGVARVSTRMDDI
eukprot:5350173-Prymnesium_polylepis.1